MTGPNVVQEFDDFSLVLGGLTFKLLRRAHLIGNSLEFLHRRIAIITLVAWLPLFDSRLNW